MSEILSFFALVLAALAYRRAGQAERAVGSYVASHGASPVGSPVTASVPATPPVSPAPSTQSVATQPVVGPTAPHAPIPTPGAREESVVSRLFAWLAIDWPMKVGAFFLFLGIGWLVSFVFWDAIGEVGRTMIGIMLGIAALTLGHWRLFRSPHQGAVIEGLGAGIISFTIFVARNEYDLLTPTIALAFLLIVTVFVNFSSIATKTKALALIGLTLGGLSPLLVGSSEDMFLALFLYLFVLSAGTLWVVRLTGWRVLTFASFLPYFLYSLPYLVGMGGDDGEQLLIAILFAGLYFLANIWAIMKSPQPDKADLITATANALVLTAWINVVIDPEWKGLATMAAAIVFSVAAIIAYRIHGIGVAVQVYAATAGLLIGIATAFEFSGAALTIAFTLEAGLLYTGTLAFFGGPKVAAPLATLFVIPLGLSLGNLGYYASARQVFTEDLAALVILIVTLLACGWLLRKISQKKTDTGASTILSVIGYAYAALVYWMMLHNVPTFTADKAATIALITFTILGLGLYVMGNVRGVVDQKRSGLAFLIFVIGHLLIVDVWTMDTVPRIITFCLIGLLLMSTAFIGRKKSMSIHS